MQRLFNKRHYVKTTSTSRDKGNYRCGIQELTIIYQIIWGVKIYTKLVGCNSSDKKQTKIIQANAASHFNNEFMIIQRSGRLHEA